MRAVISHRGCAWNFSRVHHLVSDSDWRSSSVQFYLVLAAGKEQLFLLSLSGHIKNPPSCCEGDRKEERTEITKAQRRKYLEGS